MPDRIDVNIRADKLDINVRSPVISASLGACCPVLEISDDIPVYTGEYTVVPSFTEQILSTTNKMMNDDVTVTEIPVYVVSNPTGGNTVIIGNEEGVIFNG